MFARILLTGLSLSFLAQGAYFQGLATSSTFPECITDLLEKGRAWNPTWRVDDSEDLDHLLLKDFEPELDNLSLAERHSLHFQLAVPRGTPNGTPFLFAIQTTKEGEWVKAIFSTDGAKALKRPRSFLGWQWGTFGRTESIEALSKKYERFFFGNGMSALLHGDRITWEVPTKSHLVSALGEFGVSHQKLAFVSKYYETLSLLIRAGQLSIHDLVDSRVFKISTDRAHGIDIYVFEQIRAIGPRYLLFAEDIGWWLEAGFKEKPMGRLISPSEALVKACDLKHVGLLKYLDTARWGTYFTIAGENESSTTQSELHFLDRGMNWVNLPEGRQTIRGIGSFDLSQSELFNRPVTEKYLTLSRNFPLFVVEHGP